MAGQTAKQKADQQLVAAVQPLIERGEQIRAAVPATVPPPTALAIVVPLALFAAFVVALTTLPLGAIGDLVVTGAFLALLAVFNTITTKRFALALTDRRLVWVPWNGKVATGPADAESTSSVTVAATKVGRFGSKLTLRRGDGSERRISTPALWRQETKAIAGALRAEG